MHKRIIRVRILPHKMDQAVGIFRASIKPRLVDRRGCLGIYLLVNHEINEMSTLSLWQSEEAMKAAFNDDFLDQQVEKLSLVAANATVGVSYEVYDSVEGYPYSL